MNYLKVTNPDFTRKIKLKILWRIISLANAFNELNKFQTLSHNASNFKRSIANIQIDVTRLSKYVEGQFITNKNFEIIQQR
jgi:hypothetical protein